MVLEAVEKFPTRRALGLEPGMAEFVVAQVSAADGVQVQREPIAP
jgi:hypothetical protein